MTPPASEVGLFILVLCGLSFDAASATAASLSLARERLLQRERAEDTHALVGAPAEAETEMEGEGKAVGFLSRADLLAADGGGFASVARLTGGASHDGLRLSRAASFEDPDEGNNMTGFVHGQGYPLESHQVRTGDGYILTMFRIPHGKGQDGRTATRRPAVLLQHGLLDSSMSYVCNPPDQSLAFILADAGWDVWLGNNRGNGFSSSHETLSKKDRHFWDFSLDELARYDFPAQVDYVLQQAGADRVAYVGFSQGNQQAWAGLSHNPDLNKKLSVLVALAPLAYVGHQQCNLISLLQLLGVDKMMGVLGQDVLIFVKNALQSFLPAACGFRPESCVTLMDGLFGESNHTNLTRIPVYASIVPKGTSVKNLVHLAQMLTNDKFARYDYRAPRRNLRHYGWRTPRTYSLADVAVPTALFAGESDLLSDPQDVERLRSELPPGLVFKDKSLPYSHPDFIWAYDAKELVYPDVLEALNSHAP